MNLRWRLNILLAVALISSTACEKETKTKKHYSLVYGHAGNGVSPERWVYPENTEDAILYALDVMDADGIEVDVRISQDSVAIVYHDEHLEDKTNGSGCVETSNSEYLFQLKYYGQYRILSFQEIVDICMERNKPIFVDFKHFNGCDSLVQTEDIVNKAFSAVMDDLTYEQRQLITINSRNYNLLKEIEDSAVIKSFETDNYELGLLYWGEGEIQKLCFKHELIDDEKSFYMRTNGIPFCLFGMKVQKEIRRGYGLQPDEMISDNIAFTKKLMN